jgi:O-methyltransferase involved in polyketide biosynthesis
LLTQEEQVRCFRNVAQHLGPQGRFVVEAFVPDVNRFNGQQAVRASSVDENKVRLDVSQLDPVTQQITSQQVVLAARRVRLYPVKLRYVWPAELRPALCRLRPGGAATAHPPSPGALLSLSGAGGDMIALPSAAQSMIRGVLGGACWVTRETLSSARSSG